MRAVLFSNDDRCLNVFYFSAYTELRTEEELAGGVFTWEEKSLLAVLH
ncbi:hypothetical protein B4134_1077 [Bacillus safensis]|nr:hypothetical protein B4107_0905 [Bacillus safensis]KIL22170.1 hypothetical protein B4134_1077 [Bacillus safensis]